MEQQAELNLPHVNFEEESRCAGSFDSHGGVNDALETSKVDELGQTKDGVGNAKPSQQSSKEEVDSYAIKWGKCLKNNKSVSTNSLCAVHVNE
ncbi:hypothetical protein ACOSP7_007510 [Xanthoceras sorbifolium]